MKAFAANMIVSGCQTFVRAKHIKEIENLSGLIDYQDRNPPTKMVIAQMSEFVLETIPDWIRIIICFENYMKANLLMNGFLIHKIEKNDPFLKTLANKQSKRPILLSEFKEIHNFSIDIISKNWILEGLKKQTIDFSMLLRKKYQDQIQLPSNIFDLVKDINDKRNNLHFYHEASNSYSQEFIENLKIMDRFVRHEMLTIAQNIAIELK